MNTFLSFIETQPLLSALSMTGVIIILRLFGIGKKLITFGTILLIAGGSVYLAKTMG